MKWPESLTIVRHGESAYNALKVAKETDPAYQAFLAAYDAREEDPDTVHELAAELFQSGRFALDVADFDTPLSKKGHWQSRVTGEKLKDVIPLPDVIFVSPYLRTKQTLGSMAIGWPELEKVKTVEEERIREQEHGLAQIYGDWRIFQTLNPDQAMLREREGRYWYRHPQGENVPDVRERNRSWLSALTRDYAGENVLTIAHHLTKLATRVNLERKGAEEFIHMDEHETPHNCGSTVYRGIPELGSDGRLELEEYNTVLY